MLNLLPIADFFASAFSGTEARVRPRRWAQLLGKDKRYQLSLRTKNASESSSRYNRAFHYLDGHSVSQTSRSAVVVFSHFAFSQNQWRLSEIVSHIRVDV